VNIASTVNNTRQRRQEGYKAGVVWKKAQSETKRQRELGRSERVEKGEINVRETEPSESLLQ